MKYFTVKIALLLALIIYPSHIISQNESKIKRPFLRVFDSEGKKISKGKLLFFNDSIMFLKNAGKIKEVHFSKIGYIKTKRSAGHNILASSIAGASLGVVFGISTADPDAWILGYSQGEGALSFGLAGGIAGVGIGGIAALTKKIITYSINGDPEKWQTFRELYAFNNLN